MLLKEEALRAQVDELDALRRSLRAEEVSKRELATSEKLARAHHKKVAGEVKELELLVETLRREIDTAGLTANAEREAKRHVTEHMEDVRQELQEATLKLASQSSQLQQAQELADAAEEGRSFAAADAERGRRELEAASAQARAASEDAVREVQRKLDEIQLQYTATQQLVQEQAAQLAAAGDQGRRDELELAGRGSRIAALSEMLEHVQAD